jgi:hypothetical protein
MKKLYALELGATGDRWFDYLEVNFKGYVERER